MPSVGATDRVLGREAADGGAIGLVAATLRPPGPGSSWLEDIVVEIVDAQGQCRPAGPHAGAIVQLVPSGIRGDIVGSLRHYARRGVAVFRGLQIPSPGEHTLHFCLPAVYCERTATPVESERLTLRVRPAEDPAEASAEQGQVGRVERLRLSAPLGAVTLGRPLSRPLMVELCTLRGDRIDHGARSRTRVRIETDPPLQLSGHQECAVRGIAIFEDLRVWGHRKLPAQTADSALACRGGVTAGIYGATYCFVAIVEIGNVQLGCGALNVFTVHVPGGAPLLHTAPGLRPERQAVIWAEMLPPPADA